MDLIRCYTTADEDEGDNEPEERKKPTVRDTFFIKQRTKLNMDKTTKRAKKASEYDPMAMSYPVRQPPRRL